MTKIVVTQKLIDEGERKNCKRCPVALAIIPHCSDAVLVEVDWEVEVYRPGLPAKCLTLPEIANTFIESFDAGVAVEPFSFKLDIPEWALREAS